MYRSTTAGPGPCTWVSLTSKFLIPSQSRRVKSFCFDYALYDEMLIIALSMKFLLFFDF